MNRRGPSLGYPVPRLLCLLDRASGMIAKALPLPCGRQEHTCLSRLLSLLSAGDLLLGDRGLVSFAHLALLAGNGAAGLFRLPRDKALRRRAAESSQPPARGTILWRGPTIRDPSHSSSGS